MSQPIPAETVGSITHYYDELIDWIINSYERHDSIYQKNRQIRRRKAQEVVSYAHLLPSTPALKAKLMA